MADDPNKVGQTVEDLNAVVGDLQSFSAENREALGTTSDKLASISTALVESLDDIKQALHLAPTTLQNFSNIYEPANGSFTGALAVNNFANPIAFLCGAVQAASRLGAEQSVETLRAVPGADREEPPVQLARRSGLNLFVGAQARPNEVTYSEDWMRPDYIPPSPGCACAGPTLAAEAPAPLAPLAAEAPPPNEPSPRRCSTDPAAGLPGIMVPPGGGS